MTSAPRSAARLIPCASRDTSPERPSVCLIDTIAASGATPVTGTPREVRSRPAMIPATAVPWPTQSRRSVAVRSTWRVTALASWGCVASTPLSTTATVTPSPLVSRHTRSKRSRSCGHGVPVTSATPGSGAQLTGRPGAGVGVRASSRAATPHQRKGTVVQSADTTDLS